MFDKGSGTVLQLIIAITMMVPVGIASTTSGDIPQSPSNDVNAGDVFPQGGAFVENKGQFDPALEFVSASANVAFGTNEVYYNILNEDGTSGCVLKMTFDGGSPSSVSGEGPVGTRYNYFIGDESRWATDVPAFLRVVYDDVWDGIDIVYRTDGGSLKYDIILSAGADPSDVSIEVEGAESLRSDGGSLTIGTGIGTDLVDSGLRTFYADEGDVIGSSFAIDGMSYGFELDEYDESKEVVIDPNIMALNFSTYVGGSNYDYSEEMDQDSSRNIYVCGYTSSTNFPVTSGAYQRTNTGYGQDAFLFKFDPKGKTMVFATYLGGYSYEYGTSIKVDQKGDCYLAGYTTSDDFPTTDGAFQSNLSGSYDLFISKISSSGSSLLRSTYIGGSNSDEDPDIDIDSSGNVYVTAGTYSSDFPITSDAYQDSYVSSWSRDLVIFFMDLSGMDLLYSTYLGGTSDDQPRGIIYESDKIYIGGSTQSDDFNVTSGSYETSPQGDIDGFLLKMDVKAKKLSYCTYFGGTKGSNEINGIDVDVTGNVYACGLTSSSSLPVTMGANDTTANGGADGFVMCMDPTGSSLVFSTYYGGSQDEFMQGIHRDSKGSIHIDGYTSSTNIPILSGAVQTAHAGGWYDGFYLKLKKDGSGYHYSTYLGGSSYDYIADVSVDEASGEPIILGYSGSSDFPTRTGSYDTSQNGGYDVTLTKIDLTLSPGAPLHPEASVGDSFVELSWDPPLSDGGAPIKEYQIYKGIRSGSLDSFTTITNLSYNDTAVVNGKTYYYSIRAANRVGEGPFSIEISAKPASRPDPPLKLVIEDSGNAFINLNWSAPLDDGGLDVTGYRLYRFAGASTDPKIMTFDYSIKGHMDIEVKNGINYRYYLTALNNMGESLPTPEVNATPMTYPGEVTVFTAEAGDGFVHLYWDAPEDEGGAPVLNYTILRALNNNSQWTKIVVDGDDLDYNDTSVLNGQLYRYKINVKNAVGATRYTEEIMAYPVAKPSPPENIQISMSYGTVRLTWEAPRTDGGDKIKFYTVYRTTSSLWDPLDNPDYSELSYTDSTVQNGRNYRYVVTASNEIGESAYSSEVNITPLGRPGSPLNLVPTPGDRVVHLVWEPPMDNGGTPIIRYNILRGEVVSQLVLLKSVAPDGTEYSDTTVKNGKVYYYIVKAENIIGEGAGSSIEMVKPAGVPSPPSNVRVVGGNKYVEIAWGAPTKDNGSPLTEIRIYRGRDANATALLINTTLFQGTYRDGTVINGVTYFYRMTAVNGVGESEGSVPIEATPLGKPSEVRSLTVSLSGGSVELTWQPPLDDGGAPILKYKIFRSSGTGSVLLAEIDGSITEYVDRTASAGKSYLYRVVAVNALGDGKDIDPIEVEVKEEKGLDPLLIAIPSIVVLVIVIGVVLAFYLTRSKKGETPHPDQVMMQPGMVLPQPQAYQGQIFQGQILQPLEPPAPAMELPIQETQALPPSEPVAEPQTPVSYPPAEAVPASSSEQAPESLPTSEDPMMAFYKPPEQG